MKTNNTTNLFTKRIAKLLMIIIGIITSFLLCSFSAHAEDTIESGVYDGVPWKITMDFELIIGEEGQEYAFDNREVRYDPGDDPNDDVDDIVDYPWYKMTTLNKVSIKGTVHGNGSFSHMFYCLTGVDCIDLSGFETSNVTDMSYMFSGWSRLSELDLSSLDTSNVTDMSGMFSSCQSLGKIDMTGLNTSNVMNMESMFYYCTSLSDLRLEGVDTKNVTNMSGLFGYCSLLPSLDVSSFDTSNVTDMSHMFENCHSLETLDISGFSTSNVTSMADMFNACWMLSTIDLKGVDTHSVTDMTFMFADCRNLISLDCSGFDTKNVTNMRAMFLSCNSLKELNVSSFDTSNVTNMSTMFGCPLLTKLDVSSFDTSSAIEMYGMFEGCSSLTTLDLSSFDTSNARYMNSLISGCTSLQILKTGTGFNANENIQSIPIQYASFPITMYDMHSGQKYNENARIPSTEYRTYVADWEMVEGMKVTENIKAVFSDGVLTLSGSGRMPDFSRGAAPWTVYNDLINSVVIGEGITNISAWSFCDCPDLSKVEVPSTIESIEEGAFYNCHSLNEVRYDGLISAWNTIPLKMYDDEDNDIIKANAFSNINSYADNFLFSNDQTSISQPCEYTDEFFSERNDQYDHSLAKMSLALAMSAFSNEKSTIRLEKDDLEKDDVDPYKVEYHNSRNAYEYKLENSFARNAAFLLDRCGFTNIHANKDFLLTNQYRGDGEESINDGNNISACFAEKLLKDGTVLVAVTLRGAGYGDEWIGDFNVHQSVIEHKGFSIAARQIEDELLGYFREKGIEKANKIKIWITGYSRSAAIANLVAGHICRDEKLDYVSIPRENVYAYTFETPRGTTDSSARSEEYNGIWNIINPIDGVPMVAMREVWGYQRYGNDVFLPAFEAFSNC